MVFCQLQPRQARGKADAKPEGYKKSKLAIEDAEHFKLHLRVYVQLENLIMIKAQKGFKAGSTQRESHTR